MGGRQVQEQPVLLWRIDCTESKTLGREWGATRGNGWGRGEDHIKKEESNQTEQ